MDIEAKKIELIQYLINISDEAILNEIEARIIELKQRDSSFNILTEEQLLERAKKSNKDYVEGKFLTQEELEKISENW